MERLEAFLAWGRFKKDITFWSRRRVSPAAFFGGESASGSGLGAILLCEVPILLEAIIGLVAADIKADVLLVSWLSWPRCSLERTLPPAGGLHHAAGRPFGGPHRGQGPGGD